MPVRIVLVAAILAFAVRAGAEDTTQSKLSKFGTELVAAWTTYPSEKDATIRKQKITDLTTAITTGMNKLPAPENTTVKKAVDRYLENLGKARALFRLEKMNSEKSAYLMACAAAYKREITQTTDAANERLAHKCFDLLADWAEEARVGMRIVPEEAQGAFYTNLSEALRVMMKSAKKDEGDPAVLYDRELKEIRRRFPVTSPVMQQLNQPIVTMLEAAAKIVNDFNRK